MIPADQEAILDMPTSQETLSQEKRGSRRRDGSAPGSSRTRRAAAGMWKRVFAYGALLAAGVLALQWLDYQRLVWVHSGDIYLFLVAAAFLVLGIVLGVRVFAPPATAAFNGNPQAQAAIGLSEREMDVLRELAAGRSNKEIAANLHVSPNTVKTHVARVFEKLGTRRRTEAIHRARELGIVP